MFRILVFLTFFLSTSGQDEPKRFTSGEVEIDAYSLRDDKLTFMFHSHRSVIIANMTKDSNDCKHGTVEPIMDSFGIYSFGLNLTECGEHKTGQYSINLRGEDEDQAVTQLRFTISDHLSTTSDAREQSKNQQDDFIVVYILGLFGIIAVVAIIILTIIFRRTTTEEEGISACSAQTNLLTPHGRQTSINKGHIECNILYQSPSQMEQYGQMSSNVLYGGSEGP